MARYYVQMQETATYGFYVELSDEDVIKAGGDIEEALSEAAESAFTGFEDTAKHFESVADREMIHYSEVTE